MCYDSEDISEDAKVCYNCERYENGLCVIRWEVNGYQCFEKTGKGELEYCENFSKRKFEMTIESLAYTEEFPKGKVVTIGRYMNVSSYHDMKNSEKLFVLGWSGERFVALSENRKCSIMYSHAAEITAPKTRKMTHYEVFAAIRNGAVVRCKDKTSVRNWWDTCMAVEINEICYNYTGTDADVWEKMEVEE